MQNKEQMIRDMEAGTASPEDFGLNSTDIPTQTALVTHHTLDNSLADEAVAKYLDFMNIWLDDDRKKSEAPEKVHDIEWEDFFTVARETKLISEVEFFHWNPMRHLVIRAGYGDDGGPAILFATFERWPDDGWTLSCLAQSFDMAYSILWTRQDGWLVKP